MKHIIHKVNRLLAELCGWFLMVIAGLLTIDLMTRGIGKPIQGLCVLAVFVMMIVIYLGQARCEEQHGHPRIEAIIRRLSPRWHNMVNLFCYFIELLTVAIVVYAVTQNALLAYRTKEAVSGTKPLLIWPVKFIIVIGLVFFWIQILLNSVEEFRKSMMKSKGGQAKEGDFKTTY